MLHCFWIKVVQLGSGFFKGHDDVVYPCRDEPIQVLARVLAPSLLAVFAGTRTVAW